MKESLLITGFKPFLSNEINPSELLIEKLEKLGYNCLLLDVSYQEADEKINQDYLSKLGIRKILSFGLAASREQMTIEEFAYNEINQKTKDNRQFIPSSSFIVEGGKETLRTSYNPDYLVNMLNKEGFQASLSADPGRYLCNYVYYKSLEALAGSALFVHLPPMRKPTDLDNYLSAALLLIKDL
ncbi:MAG: hypothetical protein LKJ88_08020 [Bacilli bacterium]|jgi:pyroglutamyl-peptidase|nr:hypothetical protein [Bacilli bacterium]